MAKTINDIGLRELYQTILYNPRKLTRLFNEKEELVTFNLPLIKKKLHIVVSPKDLKHMFFENTKNYLREAPAYSISRIVRSIGEDLERFPEDPWFKDIKALSNLFSKERMLENFAMMVKTIDKKLDAWQQLFADTNTPLSLNKNIQEITLSNFMNSFLRDVNYDEQRLSKIYDIFEEVAIMTSPAVLNYALLLGKFPLPTPTYLKYRKLRKKVRALSWELVQESLREGVSDFNMVKHLARSRGIPTDIAKLTEDQKAHLCGRVYGMTLAGFGTLSTAIAQTLVFLSLYPKIAEKLCEEVKSVLGSRNPTFEDIKNLPYTKSVFMESMRLHPSVSNVIRYCVEDDVLSGHKINKGDLLYLPLYVTQRFSKYWPNPEGYEPERFMKPLTPEQNSLYLVFAHGPENCAGRHYAITQAIFLLTMLAQRYRLELSPGVPLGELKALRYVGDHLSNKVTMKVNKIQESATK